MNCEIAFLGDVSLNDLISADPLDNESRFRPIVSVLGTFAHVVANLESPVKCSGIDGNISEKAGIVNIADESVSREILKMLNISHVTLANNHILDQGENGIYQTITMLKNMGIGYTGASIDRVGAGPLIVNLGEIKIGILAYVHPNTHPKEDENNCVNYFEFETVLSNIEEIRQRVDYVVLSLHWGNDYSFYPTHEQMDVARSFIDAGVKLVIGHHPHTMQPFEHYKNGLIFYSLGQLCYGDFYWQGELRALKRKSKRAAIPFFDKNLNLINFITVKERKRNNIELTNWNYPRWSAYHLKVARLMQKYKPVAWLVNIKEAVWDRIVEYFFGYYRKPFLQAIRMFKNFNKIAFIKRDFTKLSKGNKNEVDIK